MVSRRSVLGLGGAVMLAGCGAKGRSLVAPEPKIADGFRLETITDVTRVAQLTGPDGMNDTSKVLLAGCDLGSTFNDGDKTWFLFGDNFGIRKPDDVGGVGEVWKSNCTCWTTDDDPTDGLTIDGWILDEYDQVKEIIPGDHKPNEILDAEVTKIPTQGWALDGTLFAAFMSVTHWGEAGAWDAGYAGLAVSTDEGQNWEILPDTKWPGDSGFVQLAHYFVKDGGKHWLYLWGIPSGRLGPIRLMRVPATAEDAKNLDSYEYFAGVDGDKPKWSKSLSDAEVILDGKLSEFSVLYSEYLERWLLATMWEGDAVLFEGLSPWGPWSQYHTITTQSETPGLYAPYMNPRYVSEDGKRVYFTFSIWGPYQVFWYSFDLVKRDT